MGIIQSGPLSKHERKESVSSSPLFASCVCLPSIHLQMVSRRVELAALSAGLLSRTQKDGRLGREELYLPRYLEKVAALASLSLSCLIPQ